MPSAAEMQAGAIARGRARKRANALAALLCGGVPAVALAFWFPAEPLRWLVGFGVGLLWANAFEYLYHRYLLHLSGHLLAARHLQHHATVGTPEEAEHVNLGGTPLWVVLLFAVNGAPVVAAEALLGLGVGSGVLAGFSVYFLAVEEMHWRIHLGEWLPPGLRGARAHHLAHHDRPDERYNVFLPLFDWLLGTVRS
ncbi:MAG: sterol desaturase family protein [Acidobacteria bacterium]|nr:sterol desaturase family protein [Acidobacteriota bacterium]